MMVSRSEIELLLKTQRDSYSDTVHHLISSFETCISKFETELSVYKEEISELRRANKEQNIEIRDLKKVVGELRDPLMNSESVLQTNSTRIDYLEDQSRRNNLRFDGVVEENGETWEQTARKIQLLATEKLGINENIQIERAHRVGRPNPQRHRTIVAKFLRYNDKENLIRNSRKLKGTNIFINEDLCEASQAKRREQLPQLKQARSQGKIAYFVHTRLVIKDRHVDYNSQASSLPVNQGEDSATNRHSLRSAASASR